MQLMRLDVGRAKREGLHKIFQLRLLWSFNFGYLGTCTSFFRRVKGMEVSGNHKRNLKPIEVPISVRKLRYCYNLVEKPLEKWFCKTHFQILYQVLKRYDGNLKIRSIKYKHVFVHVSRRKCIKRKCKNCQRSCTRVFYPAVPGSRAVHNPT